MENFQTHLLDELTFRFNILGIKETRIKNACDSLDFNPAPHYNFEHVPTPLSAGGVGMYIDENLKYTIIEKCSNEAFQVLWVELHLPKHGNILCGVMYTQHNSSELFQEYFQFRKVMMNLTPLILDPYRISPSLTVSWKR